MHRGALVPTRTVSAQPPRSQRPPVSVCGAAACSSPRRCGARCKHGQSAQRSSDPRSPTLHLVAAVWLHLGSMALGVQRAAGSACTRAWPGTQESSQAAF